MLLSPGPWPHAEQELHFHSGTHTEESMIPREGLLKLCVGGVSPLVLVDEVAGALACYLLRHRNLENSMQSCGSPQ